MRALLGLSVFAFMLPAAAQDDTEFGNGLMERGYTDLAKEVFKNAANAPGVNKSEADMNMLRIDVASVGRIGDFKKRMEEADAVIKRIREYINQAGDSPQVVEAYGLLSEVYQIIAKSHLMNRDGSAADRAFSEAVNVCKDLVDRLKAKLAKIGDNQEQREAVDKQVMFAMYNYITAQFYKIDAIKGDAGAKGSVQSSVSTLEKFFIDFMWSYEAYLLALDASTYMGRAFQILAEMEAEDANYGGSESAFRNCFMWIGKAKSLGSDKTIRGNEEVREVVLRAIQYEMMARITYGRMLVKKGGAFKKQYQDAVDLAESYAFKWYPESKTTELGISIQMELCKALMRLGESKRAKTIADELLKLKNPKLRERIIMVMGELGAGVLSAKEIFDNAEEAFLKQRYYLAVKQYQEVLISIKTPADRQYALRCWMRIGEAYYQVGRFFEAIHAMKMVLTPENKTREEAARAMGLVVKALRALERLTEDATVKQQRSQYEKLMLDWGMGTGEEARRQAIEKETAKQWNEASKIWDELAKSSNDLTLKLESMSRIGYCRWRLVEEAVAKVDKDWAKVEPQLKAAIDAFKAHVALVRQQPAIPPEASDDVLTSMYFGSLAMSKLAKDAKDAETILQFTHDVLERFGNSKKSEFVTAVLGQRVEANAMRRKPFEAEVDFKELKKLYEKTNSGFGYYKNAITTLALIYEDEAKRVKDSEPELYNKLFDKSLEYYELALSLGGAKEDSYERVLALAELTFKTAEAREGENPTESRKKFGQARGLYERLLGAFLERVRKDPDKELEFKVRHRILRCHLGEGDFKKANDLTDKMIADDDTDIELLELKGDIQMKVAESTKDGGEKAKLYESAAEFYGQCAAKFKRVMGQEDKFKSAAYRNTYKWCKALFETSPGQQRLQAFFETSKMRGESPEWDGGEWKPKLNQIQELIEKKNPKK
jgi:tetratricopeptide (TPR) repeat protein